MHIIHGCYTLAAWMSLSQIMGATPVPHGCLAPTAWLLHTCRLEVSFLPTTPLPFGCLTPTSWLLTIQLALDVLLLGVLSIPNCNAKSTESANFWLCCSSQSPCTSLVLWACVCTCINFTCVVIAIVLCICGLPVIGALMMLVLTPTS